RLLCALLSPSLLPYSSFFFNVPAPSSIYTLSLHDALPISDACRRADPGLQRRAGYRHRAGEAVDAQPAARHRALGEAGRGERRRSEEHTSELQSRENLVCRLLLEKKKTTTPQSHGA